MAERKSIVWEQFGQSFHGQDISAEEAIKEVGGDFEVTKQPLAYIPREIYEQIRSGESVNIELSSKNLIGSHASVVRNDTERPLSVVGADYGIVQYAKSFDFLNYMEEVSGSKPKIETAGILGYGEKMFITCQLGEESYLSKDDAIQNYVVFCTSHDATMGVSMFLSPIRVICSNTLALSLKECHNKLTFKHSKFVANRLNFDLEENRKKAKKIFEQYQVFNKTFLDRMLALKEQTISKEQMLDFAANLYLSPDNIKLFNQSNRNIDSVDEISTRAKNQFHSLVTAIDNGVGQQEYRGTKLWLLNGLTTYIQNEQKWKNAETQFTSVLNGTEGKRVQKAYDYLIAA